MLEDGTVFCRFHFQVSALAVPSPAHSISVSGWRFLGDVICNVTSESPS